MGSFLVAQASCTRLGKLKHAPHRNAECLWDMLQLVMGSERFDLALRGRDNLDAHLLPRTAGGVRWRRGAGRFPAKFAAGHNHRAIFWVRGWRAGGVRRAGNAIDAQGGAFIWSAIAGLAADIRSEEHTSELQS